VGGRAAWLENLAVTWRTRHLYAPLPAKVSFAARHRVSAHHRLRSPRALRLAWAAAHARARKYQTVRHHSAVAPEHQHSSAAAAISKHRCKRYYQSARTALSYRTVTASRTRIKRRGARALRREGASFACAVPHRACRQSMGNQTGNENQTVGRHV